MEFFAVLENRRSVRAYSRTPPVAAQIDRILGAARSAPSAGNLQAYLIVLVQDPKMRAALADAALGQTFIADAPTVMVFFADPARSGAKYHERGRKLFSIQDATIAAVYAQLAASALGLASCWVGAFDDDAVIRAVGAPATLRPVAILPLGVAAETPERSPRRPRDALTVRA
jgi:nitroreductase